MAKIINYLLLIIIFVFDPLAVALVIAANFSFNQLRPKTRENLYREQVPIRPEYTPPVFQKIIEKKKKNKKPSKNPKQIGGTIFHAPIKPNEPKKEEKVKKEREIIGYKDLLDKDGYVIGTSKIFKSDEEDKTY